VPVAAVFSNVLENAARPQHRGRHVSRRPFGEAFARISIGRAGQLTKMTKIIVPSADCNWLV